MTLFILAIWGWAAGAALLFGGFLVLGQTHDEGTRRVPTWARMALSLTLVALGWLGYAEAHGVPALLLALGMTLGSVGDFILAGIIPLRPSLIGGIIAFGLGHAAYITGLFLCGNEHHWAASAPRWGAIIVWLAFAALAWFVVVQRGAHLTPLRLAALPYALLLATTAGAALGLALQAPPLIPAAIGGALFVVSDFLLAAQQFRQARFPLISDVVWLTYAPAQLLILTAIAACAGL